MAAEDYNPVSISSFSVSKRDGRSCETCCADLDAASAPTNSPRRASMSVVPLVNAWTLVSSYVKEKARDAREEVVCVCVMCECVSS